MRGISCIQNEGHCWRKTYGEITAFIAGHVAVVLDAVVCAADDDAGTPP